MNKSVILSKRGKAARKRYSQSEKFRATLKRYKHSEKGKVVQRRSVSKYQKRHPEKVIAKDAVNHAICAGKLPRPDTLKCHYCHEKAEQYHHHKDYEKEHWFDVVPACRKCHRKIHNPPI